MSTNHDTTDECMDNEHPRWPLSFLEKSENGDMDYERMELAETVSWLEQGFSS
jgi:hypothetical protein